MFAGQVLNRLTFASTLSHLRRINSPIGREGKIAKPRQLHNSQVRTSVVLACMCLYLLCNPTAATASTHDNASGVAECVPASSINKNIFACLYDHLLLSHISLPDKLTSLLVQAVPCHSGFPAMTCPSVFRVSSHSVHR